MKNKGISEIMVEMCSKYKKSGNIMVQNWEENLDFYKKIKTALLFSIYSEKCQNFCSIGFKSRVLIFVDLIFWQKGPYCGLYRFCGKNKTKMVNWQVKLRITSTLSSIHFVLSSQLAKKKFLQWPESGRNLWVISTMIQRTWLAPSEQS